MKSKQQPPDGLLKPEPNRRIIEAKFEPDVLYRDPEHWDSLLARMDVYYRSSDGSQPVMLLIHGGSWVEGDKRNVLYSEHLINFFLDRGFVVASANFRLVRDEPAPGVSYRDQLEDIAKAIKWLTLYADEYGGAVNQIFLFGYSSGAHLVSMIGTKASYLRDEGVSLSVLRAVIAVDANTYDIPLALELMQDSSVKDKIPFIESIFGEDEAGQLEASPSSHVAGTSTPFLLLSGGIKDGYRQEVSRRVSEAFKNKLMVSGHKALHVHFEDMEHHQLVLEFGANTDRAKLIVERFLEQVTGRPLLPG